MNNFSQALYVELLKARRSKVPFFTVLGFSLAPLAGGFFMIVLKDPEMARRAGLISAKAQLTAGTADWPTYLNLIAQATAIGGVILFGIVTSWVFGREYSDHTIKDLLALPTPRSAIVTAKFVVVGLWSAALVAWISLLGYGIGAAVALPPVPAQIIWQGSIGIVVSACLTIALVTPLAFFASAGHGYLPPFGMAILLLALAQIVVIAGWGEYFPWSVPALYAGLSGEPGDHLGVISYALVVLTCLIGAAGTLLWWELADQTD